MILLVVSSPQDWWTGWHTHLVPRNPGSQHPLCAFSARLADGNNWECSRNDAFEHMEGIFWSPIWWAGIDKSTTTNFLTEKIMSGTIWDRKPACLDCSNRKIVDWENQIDR